MSANFACAVRDEQMKAWTPPFFCPTLGWAERSFRDEVNRDGSPMKAHPEDYSLWHVGSFDENTGMLVPATPTRLAQATALVQAS